MSSGGKRKHSMKDSSPSVETEKRKKRRKHSNDASHGSTNTAKKNSSVRNRHNFQQRSVLDPSTSAEGGPYEGNNSTRYRCPICFERARNNEMKSLSCYHAFHQVCIDRWMHEYKECPVCGQEEAPPQNATPSLNNKDAYQCSICLEPARNNKMRSLSCYHAFHQACIDTWLREHRECPVCRQEEAPPQNFRPSNNQGGSISRRYECPICLEPAGNNEMMSLACYHSFHQACIRTWLRDHRECPVCQQEVPPEVISPSNNQTTSRPRPSNNQTTSRPRPSNNQTTSHPRPSNTPTSRHRPSNTQATSRHRPSNTQATSRPRPSNTQATSRPRPSNNQATSPPSPLNNQAATNPSPSNNQGTRNSAEYQCSICWEPARNNEMKSLPCYHAFHKACIDQWLVRNRRCPVCRHETEPSQNAGSSLNNQEQTSSGEAQTLHGRTSIRNRTRHNHSCMHLMIDNLVTTLTHTCMGVHGNNGSSVIMNARGTGIRRNGRTTILNNGSIMRSDDGNVTILTFGNTGQSIYFSL